MSQGHIAHGNDADGNRPPRSIGSSGSRLMQLIHDGHEDVELPALQRKKIRLWIESGAPYAGTYASLGTGMVDVKLEQQILVGRCAGCHDATGRDKTKVHLKHYGQLLYNLSRPAKSPLLLAPLSQQEGGWGLCEKSPAGQSSGAVFMTVDDPDYRALLTSIRTAGAELDRIKRFDMPGFKPSQHYVREMKRYGILSGDFDLALDSIDVYQVDQACWRFFGHRRTRE